VKALMAEHDAVFGGEHSEHHQFRDFWRAATVMFTALDSRRAGGDRPELEPGLAAGAAAPLRSPEGAPGTRRGPGGPGAGRHHPRPRHRPVAPTPAPVGGVAGPGARPMRASGRPRRGALPGPGGAGQARKGGLRRPGGGVRAGPGGTGPPRRRSRRPTRLPGSATRSAPSRPCPAMARPDPSPTAGPDYRASVRARRGAAARSTNRCRSRA
jgi:hypothetical protein